MLHADLNIIQVVASVSAPADCRNTTKHQEEDENNFLPSFANEMSFLVYFCVNSKRNVLSCEVCVCLGCYAKQGTSVTSKNKSARGSRGTYSSEMFQDESAKDVAGGLVFPFFWLEKSIDVKCCDRMKKNKRICQS